jgi:coatomer subunit beta'
VRDARFIARKQWFICGADDFRLRVYNYDSQEKVQEWDAHSDFIRTIAVHPSQPVVISGGDDFIIKLWNWEQNWRCIREFEGHMMYVMKVMFSPKDPNIFASASMDHTVKVWNIGSPTPNFTLSGMSEGLNSVDFFHGADKPHLVCGAEKGDVFVWDYQSKQCVHTLSGHTNNVSAVLYHPELPIIISGSEDGTVRLWNANTYRLEQTLNYGMERCWSIHGINGSNRIALGFDEGSVIIKLGQDDPAVSMDTSGKVIWARHSEMQLVNVATASDAVDGEKLILSTKESKSCEIFPQKLTHSANGRFFAVCGDGEYIIYTALRWRDKSFGSAVEFVWAAEGTDYAVRESSSVLKTYANFKEKQVFKPSFGMEALFGGVLLGLRGSNFISFYDWDQCRVVRRIVDVVPKDVKWSENGTLVALICDDCFYVLKYDAEKAMIALENGEGFDEAEGVADAFELVTQHAETVSSSCWVGDCLIFVSGGERVNYFVGGLVVTIAHLDRPMTLMGYLPKESRLYLIDRSYAVVSWHLSLSVMEYQTAILRGDFESAQAVLSDIPTDQQNRIAQFLDSQGFKEDALAVTSDLEHKFSLALQLKRLDIMKAVALETHSHAKWKQIADLALRLPDFALAEEALRACDDIQGLFLLLSSLGDTGKLMELASSAEAAGLFNVAFLCYWLCKDLPACVGILQKTGKSGEATLFVRTYMPDAISEDDVCSVEGSLKTWKAMLQASGSAAAAEALAHPQQYANLFPELEAYRSANAKDLMSFSPAPATPTPEIETEKFDEDDRITTPLHVHNDGVKAIQVSGLEDDDDEDGDDEAIA